MKKSHIVCDRIYAQEGQAAGRREREESERFELISIPIFIYIVRFFSYEYWYVCFC